MEQARSSVVQAASPVSGEETARRHYDLLCVECGRRCCEAPSGFLLGCENGHRPSLLRADYRDKRLEIRDEDAGIFRYGGWLPIRRTFDAAVQPVVYQSRGLAERLGLERLFIAFSGYWPEKGARMDTCSFKELEAYPVCARIPDGETRELVVASAGNTGRAFLQVASENAIPATVVVPEFSLPNIWISRDKHPAVTLAVVKGDVDYLDAIQTSQILSGLGGYFPEGGARNVARRDGMGTVVLAAAETIGRIPHHYFQAVGSGTGGIAAWEMSLRLAADGRYGNNRMRLHLVQNAPFAIMTEAWSRSLRDLPPLPEPTARRRLRRLMASVLSNRKPPYGITGGVYDALTDTGGSMYAVSNSLARRAGLLFEKLEGCDLDPAAAVCVGGLIQAVRAGRVASRDLVLLNITGGGERKLAAEGRRLLVNPDVFFTAEDATVEQIAEKLAMSGRRI